MPVSIQLTETFLNRGVCGGAQKQINAILNNYQNKHGLNDKNPILEWGKHVEGCCAEAAVAQYLNMLDWFPKLKGFKHIPDVRNVDVRYRSPGTVDDLFVRPGDPPDRPYVNVTGWFGKYTIHGWIWGRDAMKPVYLKDLHNGRPPLWCVPNSQLHPMSELPA